MAAKTRPEIFISATSQDLGSCRRLVRDGVLTLGCVPVLQDHFSPEPGVVREMLRDKIAACDALLHLVGECYGHEPQKRSPNQPRRSYAQLEYDIARELKKPLYVFLCADGFTYDVHEPEPEELRRLQQLHRTKLAACDDLYLPVKDSHDVALRVRELQPRLEHLNRDLKQARFWLRRGVAVGLIALMLAVGVLSVQHRRELGRGRRIMEAVADHYGQDMESGPRFPPKERFERALVAVAEQQKIDKEQLKNLIQKFISEVRSNPMVSLYDKKLADFAEQHFAEASSEPSTQQSGTGQDAEPPAEGPQSEPDREASRGSTIGPAVGALSTPDLQEAPPEPTADALSTPGPASTPPEPTATPRPLPLPPGHLRIDNLGDTTPKP